MITLTYPYTAPSLTLQLPNPVLGNADQVEEGLSVDYAYSGTVYTYITGGGTRKLLLMFQHLSFTQMANLKNFLYKATGATCGYLDFDNIQWRGIFINDPFEDNASHRERSNIALEFRGVKI